MPILAAIEAFVNTFDTLLGRVINGAESHWQAVRRSDDVVGRGDEQRIEGLVVEWGASEDSASSTRLRVFGIVGLDEQLDRSHRQARDNDGQFLGTLLASVRSAMTKRAIWAK